jgi:Tol biopolymer transport system component
MLGNDASREPAISADGRFVAFQSGASNLVSGDANGKFDIFVHDRQTGKIKIISRNSAVKPGNDHSYEPAISADGRYVAFRSLASNLVPGDANGKADIFVHDRQTGRTSIISRNSNGKPSNGPSSLPANSAGGRYVAFESDASNLVPSDANGKADGFVHDRKTGKTSIISVNSDGIQANIGGCIVPAISNDGRYVAFESESDNLVPGDDNGMTDVFVHDSR